VGIEVAKVWCGLRVSEGGVVVCVQFDWARLGWAGRSMSWVTLRRVEIGCGVRKVYPVADTALVESMYLTYTSLLFSPLLFFFAYVYLLGSAQKPMDIEIMALCQN